MLGWTHLRQLLLDTDCCTKIYTQSRLIRQMFIVLNLVL